METYMGERKEGKMVKKRCYHDRNSWIIMGGNAQWCYVCGAYRILTQEKPNICYPASAWRRPTGDKENNPWERVIQDDAAFSKRKERTRAQAENGKSKDSGCKVSGTELDLERARREPST